MKTSLITHRYVYAQYRESLLNAYVAFRLIINGTHCIRTANIHLYLHFILLHFMYSM